MSSYSSLHCHVPPTLATSSLSLPDALPILRHDQVDALCIEPAAWHMLSSPGDHQPCEFGLVGDARLREDRKSTRLNSSHTVISYAVFCLKKTKHSGR